MKNKAKLFGTLLFKGCLMMMSCEKDEAFSDSDQQDEISMYGQPSVEIIGGDAGLSAASHEVATNEKEAMQLDAGDYSGAISTTDPVKVSTDDLGGFNFKGNTSYWRPEIDDEVAVGFKGKTTGTQNVINADDDGVWAR